MNWKDVKEKYPNQWILFEALEAESKDGYRIVDEISIIDVFQEGNKALKEYSEKHKKDKTREMYVYHTSNSELKIKERIWIGARKN
jgi:histidinol dehydrogenase